jgi:uncharacterized membrane protein HdeD (DUF308 family)
MRALRVILLLGGLGLIAWGIWDYFSVIPEDNDQSLPKVILGILGIAASWLAKRRQY